MNLKQSINYLRAIGYIICNPFKGTDGLVRYQTHSSHIGSCCFTSSELTQWAKEAQ